MGFSINLPALYHEWHSLIENVTITYKSHRPNLIFFSAAQIVVSQTLKSRLMLIY